LSTGFREELFKVCTAPPWVAAYDLLPFLSTIKDVSDISAEAAPLRLALALLDAEESC